MDPFTEATADLSIHILERIIIIQVLSTFQEIIASEYIFY
jgi:hypothetical protein